MRTKKGFVLHNVCGENVVIAEGKENIDFNNIISMNETAAYIWENLTGKDFTEEDMAEVLLKVYDVDKATALADCKSLAERWIEAGICEA